MTERIKAGPVRSERELSTYTTTQAVCPKCKHQGGGVPYGVEKVGDGANRADELSDLQRARRRRVHGRAGMGTRP